MSADKKITVEELLATPFSARSEEEKSRIILHGRPTPLIRMKGDSQEPASQGKRNLFEELKSRRLKMFATTISMYDEVPWLTASATTQNFYCWPCLLFQTPDLWHIAESSDVGRLKQGVADHEFSVKHLKAVSECQTWHYQVKAVREGDGPSVYDKHSLGVIKRLVDVVFTEASTQLPPKDLDNCRSELDVERCIKSLQFLRKYDFVGKCFTDKAIDLLQNSPGFFVKLTKAIAKTMKQAIAQEINTCSYVSIILNLNSNVHFKSHISTVLRYVVNGLVCERFVEFSHQNIVKLTIEALYLHVTKIAKEFNLDSRCVALSLDGGILTSSDASSLVKACHSKLQRCVFVPCYSHTVDEVLQKSLSSASKRFESFFKIMADFHAYFWNPNSEFNVAFNGYLSKSKIDFVNISPRVNSSGWFVASDFIFCVQNHRKIFVSFLDEASSVESTLSAVDVARALGFREFLHDFLTVFLLGLFTKIFQLTSTLNSALSDQTPMRTVDKQIILTLLTDLYAVRDNDFRKVFDNALEDIGFDAPRSNEHICPPAFRDALKTVIKEVEIRYRNSQVDKFEFCRLFDFEDENWLEETSKRYKDLAIMYRPDFDLTRTLCEMETVSKHNAFSKKNVYTFHQFLHETDLKNSFRALHDLSELILALPFKPASATKDQLSVKEKIDNWSFDPTQMSQSGDTDIIFIESDSLVEMKQSQAFYERVMANMQTVSFN